MLNNEYEQDFDMEVSYQSDNEDDDQRLFEETFGKGDLNMTFTYDNTSVPGGVTQKINSREVELIMKSDNKSTSVLSTQKLPVILGQLPQQEKVTIEEAWVDFKKWAEENKYEICYEEPKKPAKTRNDRSRGWFLTINNPWHWDWRTLMEDDVQYAAGQLERGNKEGKIHIQCFIYYKNPRAWPSDKYRRAHIEKLKSFKKSQEYVTKSDTQIGPQWEIGEKPSQGSRTDHEEIGRRVLAGAKPREILESDPGYYIRYHRGLQEAARELQKHRDPDKPPEVHWLWGEAGVGKTRYVTDKHRGKLYIKDGTSFWQFYEQQEAVLIDDFDGKWPFRDFLRMMDRHEYTCNIKGSAAKLNSPFIYITCEFPPEHFWQGNELKQVTRRLTSIREIKA